ncbi:hypothetical protein F4777DRAFT_595259 [Nemania sp. FL0916]|nr:hypothetical protein F4777DRAFT_595259 [Nemania sp. FL0916]
MLRRRHAVGSSVSLAADEDIVRDSECEQRLFDLVRKQSGPHNLSRAGYDEEKCRSVLVRFCAHVPRNFQYKDGIQQIFLILREHLGDENLDLAGGVLYELIEVDCEHTDDPGAAFQRWRHDHMSRYADLELPHIPHMTTITSCIVPTEKLARWRSEHTDRYRFVLSDSSPLESRDCVDPSCIRNKKAWLIDHTFFVSTRLEGTRPMRCPNPKEFHEMQWDSRYGANGRLVEQRELPILPLDRPYENSPPPTADNLVDCGGRSYRLRHSLLTIGIVEKLAEKLNKSKKEPMIEQRRRSWMLNPLPFDSRSLSQEKRAHSGIVSVPWPEGYHIPNAIFARKFLLADSGGTLPANLPISRMPTAESKATETLVEAATTGLLNQASPWLFRGPFTPQLGFDGGLDYQWIQQDPSVTVRRFDLDAPLTETRKSDKNYSSRRSKLPSHDLYVESQEISFKRSGAVFVAEKDTDKTSAPHIQSPPLSTCNRTPMSIFVAGNLYLETSYTDVVEGIMVSRRLSKRLTMRVFSRLSMRRSRVEASVPFNDSRENAPNAKGAPPTELGNQTRSRRLSETSRKFFTNSVFMGRSFRRRSKIDNTPRQQATNNLPDDTTSSVATDAIADGSASSSLTDAIADGPASPSLSNIFADDLSDSSFQEEYQSFRSRREADIETGASGRQRSIRFAPSEEYPYHPSSLGQFKVDWKITNWVSFEGEKEESLVVKSVAKSEPQLVLKPKKRVRFAMDEMEGTSSAPPKVPGIYSHPNSHVQHEREHSLEALEGRMRGRDNRDSPLMSRGDPSLPSGSSRPLQPLQPRALFDNGRPKQRRYEFVDSPVEDTGIKNGNDNYNRGRNRGESDMTTVTELMERSRAPASPPRRPQYHVPGQEQASYAMGPGNTQNFTGNQATHVTGASNTQNPVGNQAGYATGASNTQTQASLSSPQGHLKRKHIPQPLKLGDVSNYGKVRQGHNYHIVQNEGIPSSKAQYLDARDTNNGGSSAHGQQQTQQGPVGAQANASTANDRRVINNGPQDEPRYDFRGVRRSQSDARALLRQDSPYPERTPEFYEFETVMAQERLQRKRASRDLAANTTCEIEPVVRPTSSIYSPNEGGSALPLGQSRGILKSGPNGQDRRWSGCSVTWADQKDQTDRDNRAGETGQTSQVGQAGQASQAGQVNQAGQVDRTYQTSQAGQARQVNQAGQAGRFNQTGQATQVHQTGQAGQFNQAGQAGQASLAGRGDRTVRTDLTIQVGPTDRVDATAESPPDTPLTPFIKEMTGAPAGVEGKAKLLIGNHGWLEDTTTAPDRAKTGGLMANLRRKAREFSGNAKNPRTTRPSVVNPLSISLSPRYQSLLYNELDYNLTTALDQYFKTQFNSGRLDPTKLARVSTAWKQKGRPMVVDFRYDLETQIELIAMHIDEFRFYGPLNAEGPAAVTGLLYGMKMNARMMRIRTHCNPDPVIAKHIQDAQRLLQALGSSEQLQRHIEEVAQFFKIVLQRANVEAEQPPARGGEGDRVASNGSLASTVQRNAWASEVNSDGVASREGSLRAAGMRDASFGSMTTAGGMRDASYGSNASTVVGNGNGNRVFPPPVNLQPEQQSSLGRRYQ